MDAHKRREPSAEGSAAQSRCDGPANPTAATPAPQAASVPTLATIADQIKAEHKAAERDVRSSVAHAIRCGQLLLEAKASIKHGEWEAWISDNIKLSGRAVQGYMRLAKLDATKAQRVADLSLREALKQVGQEYGRKQKRIEKQVEREQSEAKQELAPDPSSIIDVDVIPAAANSSTAVVVPMQPNPSTAAVNAYAVKQAQREARAAAKASEPKKPRKKIDVEQMIDDIANTLVAYFGLCPVEKHGYLAAKVIEMTLQYAPVGEGGNLDAHRIIKELEGMSQPDLTDPAWFAGQLHFQASRLNPLKVPL